MTMKKRDKWITIVFLLFIMSVFVVTLFRSIVPQTQTGTDSAVQDLLEQNGTLQQNTAEENVVTEESTEESQPEQEAQKQNWFLALQTRINTFTDMLFGKTKMIAFNTQLTKWMTGGMYIESTQVLVGKDNYLFYKTQNDGYPIYDYMGINHYTDEELLQVKNNLEEMRDYFEERGIEFYVFCAPNKESVYEQYMPDTVARVNETTRADQVAEYLWANSDVTYVYPKKELIEASKDYQVYYKTDTHWNQIGAFVGFQNFYETAYGQKEEVSDVHFDINSQELAGDLATIAGVDKEYAIDTVYVIDPDSANPDMFQDKTILVVGDSFGGFFSTVSKAYFGQVEWINWKDEFSLSMLEQYKPDVIVLETVERYVSNFKDKSLLEK